MTKEQMNKLVKVIVANLRETGFAPRDDEWDEIIGLVEEAASKGVQRARVVLADGSAYEFDTNSVELESMIGYCVGNGVKFTVEPVE